MHRSPTGRRRDKDKGDEADNEESGFEDEVPTTGDERGSKRWAEEERSKLDGDEEGDEEGQVEDGQDDEGVDYLSVSNILPVFICQLGFTIQIKPFFSRWLSDL